MQKILNRSVFLLSLLLFLGIFLFKSGTISLAAPGGPSASIENYSQCSNDDGDGYASGDTGCRWTNGNLQANNSTYMEDDSTVQRLHINNLTNGSHTLLLQYGTTKGGKNAYDFLTTDVASETWVTTSELCEGLTDFSSCSGLTPDTEAIPADPLALGYDSARNPRDFSLRNATITSVGAPVLASGTYAGDSETSVLVTFEVDSATCADMKTVQGVSTCSVLLTWGAHVSTQENWGDGNSAVNINGSPYHVAVSQLDGSSIGQRDNQMQAGAIVEPTEGKIITAKVTIGGDGSFEFDPSWSQTNFFLANGQSNDSDLLTSGNYSVSEVSIPASWSLTNTSCVSTLGDTEVSSSIELDAEEVVTCTFTNTHNATLTLNKVVTNDDGGNAEIDDFQASIDGVEVEWGTPVSFFNEAHTASETSLPGYEASEWGGDCAANGSITLSPGDSKVCTITNNDQPGFIRIVKNTVGGDGDFEFSVAGPTPLNPSVTTTSGTGQTELLEVNIGDYSVSEIAETGFELTGSVCDSGTPAGFTITPGQTVTCTFTNTKHGNIVIVKDAISNNAQDFVFNSNFGNGNPVSFSLDDDSNGTLSNTQTFGVIAGVYSISEDQVEGWQQENASCSDQSPINAIDVAPGETVTCTFVNEQYARIILVKTAIGGDSAFNFNFEGDGLPDTGQLTTIAGTISETYSDLDQDNTYSISETVPDGWDLTSSACSGSNTPASITPNAGETVTCTFTNTKRGHITIEKQTVPDGDSTKFAFSGNVAGDLSDGETKTVEVVPGTYQATETTAEGWDLTSIVCSDSDSTGNENVATFEVSAGEDVTCVFTNSRRPRLTIDKIVINDNGGEASISEFPLFVSETPVVSGETNTFNPGAYEISETTGEGYAATIGDACDSEGNVELSYGDDKTCTITNDDIAPSLTLVKEVNNLDGGSTSATDWTLSADGPTPIFGAGGVSSDSDFDAGTYVLSESTGPEGYQAGDWNCVGGTQNGSDITLGLAENAICTIINDDIAPTLTVIKILNPENDGGMFNLLIDEEIEEADAGHNGTTDAVAVLAGNHTISETGGTDTDLSEYDSVIGGDCAADGSITLALAEDATCTITNTRHGHLIVDKITDPVGDQTSFEVTVVGTGEVHGDSVANITDAFDVDYEVSAGTFSVTEGHVAGWEETDNTCDDIVIAPGETRTCTITNTKLSSITIVKDAQPDDEQDFSFGGTLGDFSLDDDGGLDNTLSNSKIFADILPGTYNFSETLPNAFWILDNVSCTDVDSGEVFTAATTTTGVTVELSAGKNIQCMFVNTKGSPTRTQGFWQTHTSFTQMIFDTEMSSNFTVGNATHLRTIDNYGKLFGAYYSSIPKMTNGKNRIALDKARMQLLQQLVTAKLNCAAFGCTPSVTTMITTADNAFATGTTAQILLSAAQLDAYNNSGDTLAIPYSSWGKATPKISQTLADKAFWDIP